MNKKRILWIGITACTALALLFFLFGKASNDNDLNARDSNSDGVWDDIEPYILQTSKTKYHQKALEQYFKVFQKVLLNPERCLETKSGSMQDESEKATACLFLVDKKYGGKTFISGAESAIVNTILRAHAYNVYIGHCGEGFHGSWDDKKQGSPCEFAIE